MIFHVNFFFGALLLSVALCVTGIIACKPSELNTAAPEIELIWNLEGNNTSEGITTHKAVFQLVNHGTEILRNSNWTLHWNQSPRRVLSCDGPALVQNINGDFYQMRPLPEFELSPGDTATISYTSEVWMIKETDAPLGLYLAFEQVGKIHTKIISRVTILPFETAAQVNRNPEDRTPFPSPSWLFAQNDRLTRLAPENRFPFIPSPASWTWGKGKFLFGKSCAIAYTDMLKSEGKFLEEALKERFGISSTRQGASSNIILTIRDSESPSKEGYRLAVDAEKIVVEGNSPAGVFYGIQSLLALIQRESKDLVFVPAIQIEDAPAFSYRGLHVDVCRNFQTKETIMRALDAMARYKLNRLLFYLTEDEGWRIEIKGLPELTEVGSRRGHVHRDSLYLQPAYGSGPDPEDHESPGNGFYSQEDFKDILQYAHQRHIEIIPQVNLPGHARAAIMAMELRYRRLMAAGKVEEANRYRLIDPADTSKYLSAQGYFDNTTCVCQEQVYTFFETVLDEIISMYKEAGVPIRMFHTGGDEVPSTAWTGSPVCKTFLEKHPEINDSRNLQGLFFKRIAEMIQKRGLQTGAWEEAVMIYEDAGKWRPNPDYVGRDVFPYVWNSLWGNQDLGYRLANGGYPIVMCNVSNFYFDLAYNKDPREPGLYWGGFVDTEDAFSFVPYNLYESSKQDEMGKPLDAKRDFEGMQGLTREGRTKIVGLQGQLWSETIKGRGMLEYYYLPKMLGLAQRAWQGQPAWSGKGEPARLADWNRFMNTVTQVEFPFLDHFNGGYAYRIPAPGIQVREGKVHLNSAYPGYEIRYSTDGHAPGNSALLYTGPFLLKGTTGIKAVCVDARGRQSLVSSLILD